MITDNLLDNRMRAGRLKREIVQRESVNLKRAWYAADWRIVDPNDRDLVQPRPRSKKEALLIAEQIGITILKN